MKLSDHGEALRVLKKENKEQKVDPDGQGRSLRPTQHPYSLPPSVPGSPLSPLCCPSQRSKPHVSCWGVTTTFSP